MKLLVIRRKGTVSYAKINPKPILIIILLIILLTNIKILRK